MILQKPNLYSVAFTFSLLRFGRLRCGRADYSGDAIRQTVWAKSSLHILYKFVFRSCYFVGLLVSDDEFTDITRTVKSYVFRRPTRMQF